MRPFILTSSLFAVTMILGACQSPQEKPANYMMDCLWETRAKGSYKQSFEKMGTNGLSTILPAEGGDIRGALLMNACVENRHIKAGTLPGSPEFIVGTGG